MPGWLIDSLHHEVELRPEVLCARLLTAFTLGLVAAALYRVTTHGGQGRGFLGTLVLLAVLIAVLTLVIGNSVARAFSLVGALAIVRFRTVVEETRDTAFVIYAVASGMACGAGFPLAAAAATPLVALAAWLFRPEGTAGNGEVTLILRLGTGTTAEAQVQALLRERLPGHTLVGLATARGGAALEARYTAPGLPADEAMRLVADLTRVEGVQAVELKRG